MISNGPIYHLVILLHYGPASCCCLATVVVTTVVAICSPVAQLLCPRLIAHFVSVLPHTTAKSIQVPFILCK